MSSNIRQFIQNITGITKFHKIESPCYYDSDLDEDILFPFVFSNSTLDITYEGNNFKSRMIDVSEREPESESRTMVEIIGGPYLVQSIGDNFKEYIRSWRMKFYVPNTPIELYIKPQILRVKQADIINLRSSASTSVRITDTPPINDTFTMGSDINNYFSSFIFKTPMVLSIQEFVPDKDTEEPTPTTSIRYIIFKSDFDQE
jgi:hypothetical protein